MKPGLQKVTVAQIIKNFDAFNWTEVFAAYTKFLWYTIMSNCVTFIDKQNTFLSFNVHVKSGHEKKYRDIWWHKSIKILHDVMKIPNIFQSSDEGNTHMRVNTMPLYDFIENVVKQLHLHTTLFTNIFKNFSAVACKRTQIILYYTCVLILQNVGRSLRPYFTSLILQADITYSSSRSASTVCTRYTLAFKERHN